MNEVKTAAKIEKNNYFAETLKKIYRNNKERLMLILLFAVGMIVHTIFSLRLEMMSIDPNEFGVAAWSALFTGKNWSGVMSKVLYYYGYGFSILYSPILLIFKDPFVQYKAMLLLNGAIVSIIPVITYKIGGITGIEHRWQRLVLAVVCGLYSTIFAHTKFIWNETPCVVFPWIVLYLLLKTSEIKSHLKKLFMSVFTAFVTVFAYSAHPRLAIIGISVILLIIFAKIFTGKKLVAFSGFFTSFVMFALLEKVIAMRLKLTMWKSPGAVLQNTLSYDLQAIKGLFEPEGLSRFFETLIGHLYYFSTSTWGLGGLAIVLFSKAALDFFRKRKFEENYVSNNSGFLICGIYAIVINFLAIITSVVSKFNTPDFGVYQDSAIFGRYTDSVIPLIIMLVIAYVFIYGLDIKQLFGAVITLCIIYALFFVFTAKKILSSGSIRVSPVLGIYPLRIGEKINAILTLDGLITTVSAVFCFIALMIVIVSCAKKFRKHIISLSMIAMMFYSSFYTAAQYLPFAAKDAKAINTPIYEVSKYIYDSADAPPVYTYALPRRTVSILQFLNQHAVFNITAEMNKFPENCFIVVPNTDRLAITPDSGLTLRELGTTEFYTVYAYGERALAFAHSQEGKASETKL